MKNRPDYTWSVKIENGGINKEYFDLFSRVGFNTKKDISSDCLCIQQNDCWKQTHCRHLQAKPSAAAALSLAFGQLCTKSSRCHQPSAQPHLCLDRLSGKMPCTFMFGINQWAPISPGPPNVVSKLSSANKMSSPPVLASLTWKQSKSDFFLWKLNFRLNKFLTKLG